MPIRKTVLVRIPTLLLSLSFSFPSLVGMSFDPKQSGELDNGRHSKLPAGEETVKRFYFRLKEPA